jgi:hypothetical protein
MDCRVKPGNDSNEAFALPLSYKGEEKKGCGRINASARARTPAECGHGQRRSVSRPGCSSIRMHAAAWFNHEQPKRQAEQTQSDHRDDNVLDHADKTTAPAQSFISRGKIAKKEPQPGWTRNPARPIWNPQSRW